MTDASSSEAEVNSDIDDGKLLDEYMEQDAGVTKDRWGEPVVGSKWFLLSAKWLKKWKLYKGKVNTTGMDVETSSPGPVDNSDILMDPSTYYHSNDNSHLDYVLRPGCTLNYEYTILPPKAWELLIQVYGLKEGSTMPRYSIQQSATQTFVELVFRELKLCAVLPDFQLVEPKSIFASRKQKVKELCERVVKVLKESLPKTQLENVTLWELDSNTGIDGLKDRLRSRTEGQSAELLGRRLMNMEDTIDEAELPMMAILVAEVREPEGNWLFSRDVKQFRCENCRKSAYGAPVKCECGKNCLSRDRAYHQCRNYTYALRNPVNDLKTLERTQSSKLGICGLQNLGNTCFMNSGLQCLSNTAPLTEVFLNDQYEQDLNSTNPIGTKCKLVKAYAALMKDMWYGTSSSVSPWYFKRELGDFVPQFYGFAQHDSHELVSYVLDLIHEDLNRVKNKPVPEEVKQEGLSEDQVAQRFWQNHLSRNQSHVVDLMHGQYRSEVTCPKCSKSSLTFDPFLSLSLSFNPKKTAKSMDLVCVFYEVSRVVNRIKVTVPRQGKISDAKEATARMFGINPESLTAAKVFSYIASDFFPDTLDLSEVPSTYSLVMYEIPRIERKIPVILNFYKEPESQYYTKSCFAYSRVLLIDETYTVAQTYLKIYQYIQKVRTARKSDTFDSEMTDDELPELAALEENYRNDMNGRDSSKKFKVNLVNLQREKAQGGTYYYNSYYQNYPPCDYCQRKDCKNCLLPLDTECLLKSVVEKNQSGRPFRLEIVMPHQGVESLRILTETTIHESVNKSYEEERKLKEMPFTIEECLEFSSQAETLDEQNEVYCSTCKLHVQASKRMTIFRLPKILIIHLKRFKERRFHSEKDGRLITFPLEGLDLTKFCHATDFPPVYDLYAVSNHFGGLGGGHYTAFAKNRFNGRWFNFDDSSVREVGPNPQSIVTSAAYVLFYQARETPVASNP